MHSTATINLHLAHWTDSHHDTRANSGSSKGCD